MLPPPIENIIFSYVHQLHVAALNKELKSLYEPWARLVNKEVLEQWNHWNHFNNDKRFRPEIYGPDGTWSDALKCRWHHLPRTKFYSR